MDEPSSTPRADKTGTLYWLPLVLDHAGLNPGDTLLLVALVDHIDAEDWCFVGIKSLAARARMSYGTARRRLAGLEERGFLTRERLHRDDGAMSVYSYALHRERFGVPARHLVAETRAGLDAKMRGGVRAPRCAGGSAHPDARAEVPRRNNPEGTREVLVRGRATRMPDDWTPDDGLRAWAVKNTPTVDVDREAAKFVDYWLGRGEPRASWPANFRNWLRNATTYANRPTGSPRTNGYRHPPIDNDRDAPGGLLDLSDPAYPDGRIIR